MELDVGFEPNFEFKFAELIFATNLSSDNNNSALSMGGREGQALLARQKESAILAQELRTAFARAEESLRSRPQRDFENPTHPQPYYHVATSASV